MTKLAILKRHRDTKKVTLVEVVEMNTTQNIINEIIAKEKAKFEAVKYNYDYYVESYRIG